MTFGGSDIPAGSTMSLGPLFPSSAPATSSPLTAPSPSRPSVLRQFRSLTSLNSAGSTTEALTALERGCAKLVRIEGDSANSAKNRGRAIWKNSSCREPLLERSRSLNTQKPIHWSTFNRTTLGPEPPPFAAPYGPVPVDDDDGGGNGQPSASGTDGTKEMPYHRQTDWRSLYVASFLSFCTVVQFSLYFSSMWPYLEVLDRNATESFFGYIVASYSLGQILGSPIVGFLSNRMHKIRYLLYVGLLLMFCGNGLYLSVHLFRSAERKYLLCVARFITGIGSSNISLLKAYASTASTQRDRARAIAFVTGGVALGSTMGPAFQLLFTPFGYPGIRLFGLRNFSVSMYTAPAFMACAMNCVNAVCIRTMFAENYVGVHAEQQQKSDASTADNDDNSASKLPPYDRRAALLCYGTRFTQMFVNTNLETLGAPLAMMMFAWTRADAVKYISIAQVAMSLLAFLTYVVFIVFRVDKVLSDRTNLVMSLVVLISFHVLTYSYPFLPGHVQTFRHRDLRNHSIPEPVGCDIDKFTWCDTVRPIPPVYFYICYVFCIGLAFPNINVSLNTLFSKVIGPRRQGTQQGLLQMSGGFARMLGPVLISSLYTSFGPQSAWMVELTVVSATLALWMMLFGRMVPLRLPPESVVQHPQQQHQQFERPKSVVPSSTMSETRSVSDQPLATTSSSVTTSRRRIRSLRSREERMPLVEPIDEGDEARTDMEDGAVVLNRNDTTVSTMASLR
uniref:MFS domain-containing protein n=1 Tax=Globodera pallida TaxID=36090 RepID=A0A183C112_GLOPA